MSQSRDDIYPMKFETIFIEKPWGGRALERFKGELPDGVIGETWDVSAQAQAVSVVSNGQLAGEKLDAVTDRLGTALLGTSPREAFFPIMVRHVSSRENLSVQVHPTRSYGLTHGELGGKDEAWYILEAEPGASVYGGVRPDVSFEEFRRAVEDETVESLLIAHPVREGDCIFIPAGTVHAIRAGLTLIEVCENSNTTYRVFDYGRDRGLDVEETLANVDLSRIVTVHRGLTRELEQATETVLCVEPTMAMSLIRLAGAQALDTHHDSFHIITCLEGEGELRMTNGWSTAISRGDSVLIPAAIGAFTVVGSLTALRTWMPTPTERGDLLAEIA